RMLLPHLHIVPLYISLHLNPLPTRTPLFPYTTLFRSIKATRSHLARREREEGRHPCAEHLELIDGELELGLAQAPGRIDEIEAGDRKSTRLNSSHVKISYAVFCLKKKNIANPGKQRKH